MKKVIVGLLICCSIGIQAQNNAIQNALKTYDYEQAIKLIAKERKTPEMDLLKAKCFKNIALYNDAIVLLEELVKHDISNNSAVNELADCYQQVGNFSKSKLYYFMALQSNPTNRFAQLNYLNINYKLKDWKQTIQLAHSILEKDSLPFLFPVLGDCFAQLSKTDSAIYYYKKAVISNPEDYNTLSKLSGIYLHAEKYTDLINSTNRFILSDSSNQVINQYNGIGLCLNKNYERAIYRLNKLFQQGDSSFLTNYYLGASYFAIQDYISAFDQLNRAYNKDSSNIGMYYYLGKSAIFSGHQQKGIQVLSKGLTMLIPNDSVLFNYYYNISQAYNRLNKPTEEIKYLKLCCQCLPGYRLGLYTIGSIYDNTLKKPEEAMKYYNLFMATRSNAKADSSNSPQTASYYNATQARMNELKEDLEQAKTKY
ncbi:MAG: CDC27 family protein [Paludibacter sp.]|nr:CDC27 family protein [Paludibacter sp.]